MRIFIFTIIILHGFLRHSPPEPITINEPAAFEERYGINEGTSRAEPRLFIQGGTDVQKLANHLSMDSQLKQR